MAGEDGGVIEDGYIYVVDGRIEAIGESEDLSLRGDYETVDLDGKTIVPGFIDAHAHGPQGTDELIPQQNWEAVATLALGVTTIFDPSSRASEIFAAGEMQRAGLLLAPRTYSTGEVIYGAKAPGFVAEGGSLYHMDMSLVQDGNTSVEHNLPQAAIYDDVIQMYGQTNVAYTPTLAVTPRRRLDTSHPVRAHAAGTLARRIRPAPNCAGRRLR